MTSLIRAQIHQQQAVCSTEDHSMGHLISAMVYYTLSLTSVRQLHCIVAQPVTLHSIFFPRTVSSQYCQCITHEDTDLRVAVDMTSLLSSLLSGDHGVTERCRKDRQTTGDQAGCATEHWRWNRRDIYDKTSRYNKQRFALKQTNV